MWATEYSVDFSTIQYISIDTEFSNFTHHIQKRNEWKTLVFEKFHRTHLENTHITELLYDE